MIADLERIRERWNFCDRDDVVQDLVHRTNELRDLVNNDVPAMFAELEQWRAGTQGARLLPIYEATIAALKSITENASLLSAYIEGVARTGAGQRDTASNMVLALNASVKLAREVLRQLEQAHHDTVTS